MDGAKPAAAAGAEQKLEDALLQVVHQYHHHQSLRQRQQTESAKKDALRSAARVADRLVNTVDGGGVQELFVDEKRVELEARALLGTIARYRNQTDQWLAATDEINSVLKEIGDFENWMKIMDFDCKSINAAIRNIHHQS